MKMDDPLKLALLEVWDYALCETSDGDFATQLFHELYEFVTKRIEEWKKGVEE